MVGPDQIGYWIEQLKAEHGENGGDMSVEKAKNMLVLCACVESAVTCFLIKHEMQVIIHGKKSAQPNVKGRADV